MHLHLIVIAHLARATKGFLSKAPQPMESAEMKKIIIGTIAAATVIAAASTASAQNRMERNWTEMRATHAMHQSWESPSRRNAQSYGNNIRFEASDRVK